MVAGKIDIVVIQGDIADETADALISPDDTHLSMSGGASAALRDAGGPALYEAAQDKGPLEVGEVAVTDSFGLFSDYVIHAAGKPALGRSTKESVRRATESALKVADEYECRSVVIPPLGSGVGGFSSTQSAELVCNVATDTPLDSLTEIRIVTRSSENYRELFDTVADYR